MKSLFHIFLLSFCITSIQAQSLHFKYGNAKEVSVKQLDIEFEVANNIVRTTITADFYNPLSWRQEGEIIVPLPPGATISGYELEINGRMRKASVVEKEKALRAYEEIKARNVDPGLVEKKKNNHFRIRVFPILGKETKKTKLTYVYRLPKVGNHYLYKLPLNLTSKVKKLNITVSGDCKVSANKMAFETEYGKQTYSSENNLFKDTISLSIPFSNKPTLTLEPTEDGEQVHALYSIPAPEDLPLTRPYTPEKINILWDTSDVANDRELLDEIKLLERYFLHNRNTQVTLHTIGYSTKFLGSFKVIDADWKKLQTALLSLHYDGAAKLTPEVLDSINKDEFTLLFSSNKAQTHHISKVFTNLKIINSTQNFKPDTILTELSQQRLSVITQHPVQQLPSNDPQLLHYFITSPKESLTISLGYGNKAEKTFKIDFDYIYKTIRSPLKTIIAQENMLHLERTHASKETIIDYCKKHQLTSDHTSMIVLETLRDYLTYKIEPQDSKMREEYLRIITRKAPVRRYSNLQESPVTHPWYLQGQLPAIDNIKTFKLATERFFLQEQYSPEPLKKLETWLGQLEKLREARKSIDTQTEYMQWIKQVSEIDEKRRNFFSEKAIWPKDKDIFVSLRGIVPEQKVHQIKPNTDLRTFLHSHDLKSVALYRNSHRKIINLASEKYQQTPLQTGDMIVALERREVYEDGEDDPRKQPFITDDGTDLSKSVQYDSFPAAGGGSDGFGADPFGGGPFGDGGQSQIIGMSREQPSPINKIFSPADLRKTATTADDWKKFETSLKENAEEAYLKLKSNSRHNHHFYTHAARILYAHGKTELARKALSNITAGEEYKSTAKKRHLLWLIEFQDYQHVIDLIKSYDPQLTNPTIRFLLIKAHLLNNSFTRELEEELTKNYDHLGLHDLIQNYSNTPPAESYDIHITAVAETNGVSRLLKIDFKDTYTKGFDPLNIYQQGLQSIGAPGVSTCKMQQAIPGDYKVSIANNIIATYQIDIRRHWGTPKATTKRITINTDGTSEWKEIHAFNHQFPDK